MIRKDLSKDWLVDIGDHVEVEGKTTRILQEVDKAGDVSNRTRERKERPERRLPCHDLAPVMTDLGEDHGLERISPLNSLCIDMAHEIGKEQTPDLRWHPRE